MRALAWAALLLAPRARAQPLLAKLYGAPGCAGAAVPVVAVPGDAAC